MLQDIDKLTICKNPSGGKDVSVAGHSMDHLGKITLFWRLTTDDCRAQPDTRYPGSVTVMVNRPPSVRSALILPPCCSVMAFAVERPMPWPPVSELREPSAR